jgi:hypothetical protein
MRDDVLDAVSAARPREEQRETGAVLLRMTAHPVAPLEGARVDLQLPGKWRLVLQRLPSDEGPSGLSKKLFGLLLVRATLLIVQRSSVAEAARNGCTAGWR